MSWSQAEEDRRQEQLSSSQFLKPQTGFAYYVVLLSSPTKQDKVSSDSRPFTVYAVEVWNVEAKRKQTFDMAPRAFDALVDLKKRVGVEALTGQVLRVVRSQGPTQYDVNWQWSTAGDVHQPWEQVTAAMVAAGVQPPAAAVTAEERNAPWAKQLEALRAAPDLPTLRKVYTDAMGDLDLPDEAAPALTRVYNNRKRAFEATSGNNYDTLDGATDLKSLQALFVTAYNNAKKAGNAQVCSWLQERYNSKKAQFVTIAEPSL